MEGDRGVSEDGGQGQRYWSSFYGSSTANRLIFPSQFAAFIASELTEPQFLIDLGCGTGRDAVFFSTLGHQVIGVDASTEAIALCRETARKANCPAKFMSGDIGSESSQESLVSFSKSIKANSTLVYMRFFLHAVSVEIEDAVLALCIRLKTTGQSVRLAAEFRTHRDAGLPKATAAHYRRFIDPLKLTNKASAAGFRTEYFVEGFGFAKYRDDDAHVARVVFAT